MKTRLLLIALLFIVGIAAPVWAVFCPGCGAKGLDDAKFCAQCGKSLPTSVSVPTTTEVSPIVITGAKSSTSNLIAPPSPQAFQVTTHYLMVNGYRISQNGLFWVAEINNGRARIWCMNEPPTYGLIMGWVPFSELEKRTTWRSNATVYCVEPPPPSAEIVIVENRPYWRHWHPQPYAYSWGHGHGGYRSGHRGGHHGGH